MQRLVVKWLVDYASSRPSVDSEPDHTGDVVQMTLNKSLSAIEWVDPDNHILLVYFIRELEKVPSSF